MNILIKESSISSALLLKIVEFNSHSKFTIFTPKIYNFCRLNIVDWFLFFKVELKRHKVIQGMCINLLIVVKVNPTKRERWRRPHFAILDSPNK